jgi:hypothetical protein
MAVAWGGHNYYAASSRYEHVEAALAVKVWLGVKVVYSVTVGWVHLTGTTTAHTIMLLEPPLTQLQHVLASLLSAACVHHCMLHLNCTATKAPHLCQPGLLAAICSPSTPLQNKLRLPALTQDEGS